MSVELERSPEGRIAVADDLDLSVAEIQPARTLAELPLGARLIMRCRKDWRIAAVAAVAHDVVTLTVCSPTGHTYRVRRSVDAALTFDGHIPILTDREHTGWRVALARYDARW